MKREFVMLAKKYDRPKHRGLFYWSIKLDGMRAFWDGGITRGKSVPWSDRISTGLFSRYMLPIFAPDWWLDQLPPIPLDGELWAGVGNFQQVMSICKRYTPDQRWSQIKYMVFDYPGLDTVFEFGKFTSAPTTCLFDHTLRTYLQNLAQEHNIPWQKSKPFNPDIHDFMCFDLKPNVEVVEQRPWNPEDESEILNSILADGHEGIVLRKVGSLWLPERSNNLLKIKPWIDSEATVIGCTFGRETDKDSRLRGSMGALLVNWNGKEFKVSGFTDQERTLIAEGGMHNIERMQNAMDYAYHHPGEVAPKDITPLHFPIGTRITFKYRELTDEGKPKEARYWRKR